MYIPKSAGEAKPFTLPLAAVRQMLYGRYDNEAGRTANKQWTAFQNGLTTIELPQNYWDSDPHIQANLPDMDPHTVGRIGTIWVSPNFADLITEVFAVSMMRTIPTLPVSSFWANAQPNWVPKTIDYPVRQLQVCQYWSASARSLADLNLLTAQTSRVIIGTAYPDVMGQDVLIDYPDVLAQTNVGVVGAWVTAIGSQPVLALGDRGSNLLFTNVCASPQLMQALAVECVTECADKGLKGIELGWAPADPQEMQLFDQLVFILEATLTLAGLTLGIAASVAPPVPYSAPTLAKASWINVHAYGYPTTFTGMADTSADLVMNWLSVADPAKLSLVIPCVGRDGSALVGYTSILSQFGAEAAQTDVAGTIEYNGVPTVVAKTGLARTLGLAGIAFSYTEYDSIDPQLSLVQKGTVASLTSNDGDPNNLSVLAMVKGWSIVSGPCDWADAENVAIMLIDQQVPYSEGGRQFVNQTLSTLGASS